MDWFTIATNFGMPSAALIGLCFVIYKALVWVGKNIAEPVALRHIKFLDELSTAAVAQAQALQTMVIQQTKQHEEVSELMEQIRRIINNDESWKIKKIVKEKET